MSGTEHQAGERRLRDLDPDLVGRVQRGARQVERGLARVEQALEAEASVAATARLQVEATKLIGTAVRLHADLAVFHNAALRAQGARPSAVLAALLTAWNPDLAPVWDELSEELGS